MGFFRKKDFPAPLQEAIIFYNRGDVIKQHVKSRNEVLFGGRAVEAQLGVLARGTKDYDVKSKNPNASSKVLNRTLNRKSGGEFYYQTPSRITKGVYKVIHVGNDLKKGTRDDLTIADFGKFKRGDRFVVIDGIRYATLANRERDARRALTEPQFAFRSWKDKEDLARIKVYRNLRNVVSRR